MSARVMDEIVRPLVAGMAKLGTPFAGLLFVGLMMTADGPKVIEFNVRFGDPETQAILPRLAQDLLPLLKACADGTLVRDADLNVARLRGDRGARGERLSRHSEEGRGNPRPRKIEAMPDVIVTHAGTKRDGEKLIANGGRVLNVTGLGATLDEARARAYAAIAMIDWPDAYWRRDIGEEGGDRSFDPLPLVGRVVRGWAVEFALNRRTTRHPGPPKRSRPIPHEGEG